MFVNPVITRNHHSTLMELQKCFIPNPYFNKKTGYSAEDWSVVRLESGKKVICQLFPNEENNLILVNNAVSMKNKSSHQLPDYIKEITIHKEIQEFKEIKVEIFLNESSLDRIHLFQNQDLLDIFLRSILKMFKFCQCSSINLSNFDDFEIFFISKINILSTNLNESILGFVNDITKIVVEDIRYENNKSIKYEKLGGLEEVYQDLLKNIKRCSNNSMDSRKLVSNSSNILLVGPSGSGKSSLIENLVVETGANLFLLSTNSLSEVEGETKLTENINKIIQFNSISKRPIIIVVEDVESLCPKSSNNRFQNERICHEFLTNLDRLSLFPKIVLISTSRDIGKINEKARRPGRLDQEIFIKVPTDFERRTIVEILLDGMEIIDKESVVDHIVKSSMSFVGGDLLALLQNAVQPNSTNIAICDVDKALKAVRSINTRSNPYLIEVDPSFKLDSLGGLSNLKRTLDNALFRPLKNPDSYKRFGIKLPKGLLLYGPPGCAKTTLVKCLANELKRNLVSISAAQLYSPYVGDSEQLLSNIFHNARICAPSIIFIDEIDSIIGNRTTEKRGNNVQSRILSILLVEMDGIGLKVETNTSFDSQILVIGATNRPDIIDDALMRPGRFDRLIYVPPPAEDERLDILTKFTASMPLTDNVNLSKLNGSMTNFSGADIINYCNEVILNAVSKNNDAQHLEMRDFEETLLEIRPSLTDEQIKWYEEFEDRKMKL